jgi:hypothetical protein
MISKYLLGIAGEYAVATELCRRNIYAQLTLGTQKRTDLLVSYETGRMARIEVKSKQRPDWPNCLGIASPEVFIVFVDFERKTETDRPDFYILSLSDWNYLLQDALQSYLNKYPTRHARIDEHNILVLDDEVNKYGKPYRGMGIRPKQIQQHQDAWFKIMDYLDRQDNP